MTFLTAISHRLSKYMIPLLIVLNLCITVILASRLNVWIDEAYSLYTTGKDLGYALNHALYFELQPPLYFVLLKLWRSAVGSPFLVRLFSIFCVSITIYVVSKVSQRYFKDTHPGWIAACIAFNPFMIWAAVEIRMYALVILLSALLLLCFYDGYLSDMPVRRARWLYIVLSILALYTQYYLGFLLAANAFVLIVFRRWKILADYVYGMILVGFCFTPMLYMLSEQLTSHANTIKSTEANSSILAGIKFIYKRILLYVLPGNLESIEILKVLRNWIFRCCLACGLFLIVRKYRGFAASRILGPAVIVSMLCVAFIAIRNFVGLGFLGASHTAVLFLPSILLVFAVINAVPNRRVLIAGSLIMLFFSATSLSAEYAPMAKNGDWARVASYIMKSEISGEPILIFRNEGILPLKIYYAGPNKIVPIPHSPDLEKYSLRRQALHDESEIINALAGAQRDYRRVWLVTAGTAPYLGIDFGVDILENFVTRYCTVLSRRTFYGGSEVRLLSIKAKI